MTKEEIFDIIVGHIREIFPSLDSRDIQQGDSLRALGVNSVDRADILMMTLESLSLNIPMVEMAKAENIGELAGIIHARR